jgi:hypothetical protein
VQTATGIAAAGLRPASGSDRPASRSDRPPEPLPAQVLDHATGYLAAFAVLSTLARRQREGGSWHIRLSLAQTGAWLQRLGRHDNPEDILDLPDPGRAEVDEFCRTIRSEFGELSYVTPPGALAGVAAPRWDSPPASLGASPPTWASVR